MLFGAKLKIAEDKNEREFFIKEENKTAYLYVTNEALDTIFAHC